jgi:hypothetical protein
MEKIDDGGAAFPQVADPGQAFNCGLTKRELLSAMILQGLLASPDFDSDLDGYSKTAIEHADTLLYNLKNHRYEVKR